jgi:hypothetical protein
LHLVGFLKINGIFKKSHYHSSIHLLFLMLTFILLYAYLNSMLPCYISFLNFNLLHGILNSMSIYIIICSMLSSCMLFSFVMCVSSCFFNACLIMASLILTILAFVTLYYSTLNSAIRHSYILSRFIYLSPFVFHVNSIMLYCIRYLMPHY